MLVPILCRRSLGAGSRSRTANPVDMNQRERADAFRALHRPGDPVLLPNVWDAAGARLLASLGFPAVATSSAAIAYLEGSPDGEVIGRDVMLAGIARVAHAVDLPVTADLEGGYGPTTADAVATARGAIEAGAIGMNFEDATKEPGRLFDAVDQASRIAAMRKTVDTDGVPLVINARTDVYLHEIGDPAGRFDEAVRRGKMYRAAGADCIFVPGVIDAPVIAALVAAIDAPINILSNVASPPVAVLRSLGVARISLGSAPYRAAMTAFRDMAIALRDAGTFDSHGGVISHGEFQALMG